MSVSQIIKSMAHYKNEMLPPPTKFFMLWRGPASSVYLGVLSVSLTPCLSVLVPHPRVCMSDLGASNQILLHSTTEAADTSSLSPELCLAYLTRWMKLHKETSLDSRHWTYLSILPLQMHWARERIQLRRKSLERVTSRRLALWYDRLGAQKTKASQLSLSMSCLECAHRKHPLSSRFNSLSPLIALLIILFNINHIPLYFLHSSMFLC